MKVRIILSVAAFLSVLAWVACGSSSQSSTSTTATAPTSPGTASSSPPLSSPTSTGSSGSNSGSSGSNSGSTSGTNGSSSGSSGSGGSGNSGSSGNAASPAAYAYVGTAQQSTAGIYGFSIAPDGTAASVPGSPAAGPSSYVVTNSAFVFGTDTHNIASYKRGPDGSLEESSSTLAVLNNGPGQLWAIGSLSLDHTGQTLYASENAGADDTYYFFFSIAPDGKITNIGKIGPKVDYVSPLVFSPNNQFAYGFGCFHLGWDITSFRRNSDGSLTPFDSTANTQPVPEFLGSGQMYCPEGEAVSQMGYLAVADSAAGTGGIGLGTYHINADGTLTFMPNSTVTTQLPQGSACCGMLPMNFDRTGRFLALAGNGGIQVYELMPGGSLTPVGGLQATGPDYLAVQWDVDNHLYAISSEGLHVFTSAQGILTPTAGSPHPAGAAGSLAVLPAH